MDRDEIEHTVAHKLEFFGSEFDESVEEEGFEGFEV